MSQGATVFDRRLLAPMMLGSILNPINSSILAVALVPIGLALGAPPAETAWLVTALYLATAVGQPVVGRFVDRFGPRPLYLMGTGLVGIAGLVGWLAPSLPALVVARILLGLGTSAAYPASMTLIRGESERTGNDRATGILALLSMTNQVIIVIGPTLGGILIAAGGWRLIFSVNIPLSVLCLILGFWILPRTKLTRRQDLDLPGMALFAAALTAAMGFLMAPQPSRIGLVILALLLGGLFVRRELRVEGPFLDLRMLGQNRPLLFTYLRQFLGAFTSYSLLYGFTQWLEAGRGLNEVTTGLLIIPLSGSALAVTAWTGRSPALRGKLLVGSALQVLGGVLLLFAQDQSSLMFLGIVALIFGIPQGLVGLANQNALYQQASKVTLGASSGLLRTFMYLGALGASAVNAAAFRHEANTPGLHLLAAILIATSIVLFTLSTTDRALKSPQKEP